MESRADEHEHPFLEWLSFLLWIFFFAGGCTMMDLWDIFLCLYGFFMTQIPSFFYSISLGELFYLSWTDQKKINLRWKEFTYLSYVFRATKTSPHSDSAFNIFNIILNPRMRSGIENDSPDYHNLTISGRNKIVSPTKFLCDIRRWSFSAFSRKKVGKFHLTFLICHIFTFYPRNTS